MQQKISEKKHSVPSLQDFAINVLKQEDPSLNIIDRAMTIQDWPLVAALGSVQNDVGDTAAHKASFYGILKALEILQDAKVDLTVQNNAGETPAHRAVERGHVSVLEFLRDSGVDLAIKDELGETPAHKAARHGRTLALEFLRKNGFDSNVKNKLGQTPADLSAARRSLMETYVAHGFMPPPASPPAASPVIVPSAPAPASVSDSYPLPASSN